MTTHHRLVALALAIVVIGAMPGLSRAADSYPAKPVDLIVPFPPGGGADVAARLYATYLTKKWNVSVNVVNKAGGGGIVGVHEALQARPDGYTMLCVSHTLTIMGAFAKSLKLPFRWDDQTFISRVTVDPAFYVVRPDAPWKSLQELADFVRKNPKAIKLGASGRTGIGYLAGVQFLTQNNIPLDAVNYVSFTGNAPVVAALAGSHIDLGSLLLSEMFSMYEAKKLRALAVVWDKRLPMTPDVPTAAEAGYPKLDGLGWHGVSGPAGLPEEVVTKWSRALEEAAKDPAFVKMASDALKIMGYQGPKEFRDFLNEEHKRRTELAQTVEGKN
jgi:tripartite-type tricarboxylate transporter receptor subunit TctC